MKVYLSGPMTGIPDFNEPAFAAAAEDLRARGYEVVSPPEADHNEGVSLGSEDGFDVDDVAYERFIERDLSALASCDAIAFLPGWARSGGAGREGLYAVRLGLPLYMYEPGRPLTRLDAEFFGDYSTTKRREKPGDGS